MPWDESSVHPSVWRNHSAIGSVLAMHLEPCARVLEIGAGSGAHVALLHNRLRFASWQCTEQADAMAALEATVATLEDPRVLPPRVLQVGSAPVSAIDATVWLTVNTLHIMSATAVAAFLAAAGAGLPVNGMLLVYGPFAIGGRHISAGNERFDTTLRASGTGQGIRDIDDIAAKALSHGLVVLRRYAMPANNCMVVFAKCG